MLTLELQLLKSLDMATLVTWQLLSSFKGITFADFLGRPLCLPNTYSYIVNPWTLVKGFRFSRTFEGEHPGKQIHAHYFSIQEPGIREIYKTWL